MVIEPRTWLREIRLDDMSEELKDIAGLIGFENTIKLVEYMGGCNLYIPGRALSAARKRYIRGRFNGNNVMELAVKTGLSIRQVQYIVRDVRGKTRKRGA